MRAAPPFAVFKGWNPSPHTTKSLSSVGGFRCERVADLHAHWITSTFRMLSEVIAGPRAWKVMVFCSQAGWPILSRKPNLGCPTPFDSLVSLVAQGRLYRPILAKGGTRLMTLPSSHPVASTPGATTVQHPLLLAYSYRNASMGSRRDARTAGIMPLTNPTTARMVVETNTVVGEMMSRMSPISPCCAKAL
jgi:hypothetical protein